MLWGDTGPGDAAAAAVLHGRRDALIPSDYKCHAANKPTLASFLIGQPNPRANTADK